MKQSSKGVQKKKKNKETKNKSEVTNDPWTLKTKQKRQVNETKTG